MIQQFLCFLGFHEWIKVIHSTPTRRCPHCTTTQQLFRGCGGDDWMTVPNKD